MDERRLAKLVRPVADRQSRTEVDRGGLNSGEIRDLQSMDPQRHFSAFDDLVEMVHGSLGELRLRLGFPADRPGRA